MTVGRVTEWYDELGWGVVECDAAPGGCWVHFSTLMVPGFRSAAVGQELELTIEEADQDGYRFRAVEAWPVGAEPERPVELPGGGGGFVVPD